MKNQKNKTIRKKKQTDQELDSVYFLKLVMYVILGTQWLRLTNGSGQLIFSLPIGLIIGVLFAIHDHFKIDRKIEFAVLLIAMLVGFYAEIGIKLVIG